MARRFICGFETPYAVDPAGMLDASRAQSVNDLAPGRCGGYALAVSHSASADLQYEHDILDSGDDAGTGALCEPSYSRFYIKVLTYPNSGGSPVGTTFWSATGDADVLEPGATGIPSVFGVLLADGTLKFYSAGTDNTSPWNLMGTITTPLSLNVWYRVNIFLQFDTVGGGNSDAKFLVQIADAGSALPSAPAPAGQVATSGTRAFYFGGSSAAAAWATGINRDTNDGRWFEVGTNSAHNNGLNGGAFLIDDWVIDDAEAPGEGMVTCHRPISAGTYAEWASNSFRYLRSLPNDLDSDQTSNGASTRLSFPVESFASKGVTGTIKSVKVTARISAPRNDWAFGILQNGVATYMTASVAASTASPGWLIDAALLPITVIDTLEIILRDGSGAGANATADFACLMVDVEQPHFEPEALATVDDIQVYEGTFVGAGAFLQDVPVPFATSAEPDFIIVKPDNNGGTGGWWHRGMGDRGDGSLRCLDANDGPIAWVDSNSFTIRASQGVGDVGETNRFVAVSDPSNRLGLKGKFSTYDSSLQVDGRFVGFSDATFVPEALFMTQLNPGFDDAYYRGPGYVGDLTGLLDADSAATANIIESMSTGGFYIGTWPQGNTSRFSYYAIRTTDVFSSKTLCEVGSYTGDGTASRDIPLTLTGSDGPGFILVIPHDTAQRCCRFGSQSSGNNYRWNATTLNTTTGITAFSISSFTVTTGTPNLNASGVIYDYIAFGIGLDEFPDLRILPPIDYPNLPFPGEPGSLCGDCGCRMADVLPEDRTGEVPRERPNAARVDAESRVFRVLADPRRVRIAAESRSRNVECA